MRACVRNTEACNAKKEKKNARGLTTGRRVHDVYFKLCFLFLCVFTKKKKNNNKKRTQMTHKLFVSYNPRLLLGGEYII